MAINKSKNTDKPEVSHPQLRKTKICSFFQHGRCRYGKSCTFAHDKGELEATPDLMKTQLCKHWVLGICPFSGADCRFAHGKKDLRKASAKLNNEELCAAVAAPLDNRIISKAAPPAWLLPRPTNKAFMDKKFLPPQPGLEAFAACKQDEGSMPPPPSREPMKVTPAFSMISLGGILPAPSATKLQLSGQAHRCNSLPSTASSTTAADSSDDEGGRSCAVSEVYDKSEDWMSGHKELAGLMLATSKYDAWKPLCLPSFAS